MSTKEFQQLIADAQDHLQWRDQMRGDRPTERLMRAEASIVIAAARNAMRFALLCELAENKDSGACERIFGQLLENDDAQISAQEFARLLDVELERRASEGGKPFAFEEGWTEVPVWSDFHAKRMVGSLRVRTSALPVTPEYSFAISYTALEFAPRFDQPGPARVTKYQLNGVAPVSDQDYSSFLCNVGSIHGGALG